MIELDAVQLDAITEVINIGMGLAASSLSEMVNEEISLSVPRIVFVSKEVAAHDIAEDSQGKLSGVSQSFSGRLNGEALLLFPEKKSLELVRLLLKDSMPLDALTEMEQEALSEIGNIILNAGLSSISNFLGTELRSGLPQYLIGNSLEILESVCIDSKDQNDEDIVLFIRVDFGINKYAIDGYVVFLMNIDSLQQFVDAIDSQVANF